jgi:dienelactone hydrolase
MMRARLVSRAGALACAAVCAASTSPSSNAAPPGSLTLPEPSVSAPIGTRSVHWIDRSHRDPYAPDRRSRELMVQLWYPAQRSRRPRAPYMPTVVAKTFRAVAPAALLESTRTHARESAAVAPGRHPVVLLATGAGETRALYTLYTEDLAARGYVVVAVDHTYETRAVVFPGGRVVPGLPAPPTLRGFIEWTYFGVDVRVQDTRFVLDRLAALNRHGPFAGRLDLAHIGMVGHSLGGATAAEVMLVDKRVDAALDLDGLITPNVVRRGLDRPFMVINAPPQPLPKRWPFTDGYDRGPGSVWDQLRGPRFSLILTRSGHDTFTDLVAWQTQIHTRKFRRNIRLGSIAPGRALVAVRAYVNAFFQRYLRDRPAPLLDGPSTAYPEMRFVP